MKEIERVSPVKLSDVLVDDSHRIVTGIEEFNRVLGEEWLGTLSLY